MADPHLQLMLTYKFPDRRAGAVRQLLESHRPAGVRFEEEQAPWWGRLFGNRAIFSIRCPASFAEQLHRHLVDGGP